MLKKIVTGSKLQYLPAWLQKRFQRTAQFRMILYNDPSRKLTTKSQINHFIFTFHLIFFAARVITPLFFNDTAFVKSFFMNSVFIIYLNVSCIIPFIKNTSYKNLNFQFRTSVACDFTVSVQNQDKHLKTILNH